MFLLLFFQHLWLFPDCFAESIGWLMLLPE